MSAPDEHRYVKNINTACPNCGDVKCTDCDELFVETYGQSEDSLPEIVQKNLSRGPDEGKPGYILPEPHVGVDRFGN